MERRFAGIIQILFHPLLISTIGMLILFRTNLYVAFISSQIREVVMIITIASTCLIPLIFVFAIGALKNRAHDKEKFPELTVIYLLTAVGYYIGYLFISKIRLAGFFNLAFLAGTLVLVALSLISLRWKISSHMAGLGAIAGSTIAIMLNSGVFDLTFLSAVLLAGGLTGFSVLALTKNNPAQVLAGYMLGFIILFSVFSYI